MQKLFKIFNHIEEKFLTIGLAFLVLITFLQVIMRITGNANSWSEETARYLYIWLCWVGLSYCQREHEHIRITFLRDRLGPLGKKIIELIVIVSSGVFSIILAYLGLELVTNLIEQNTQSPYLNIPMWIIYAAVPVGCIFYVCRLVADAIAIIKGKEEVA